MNAREGLSLEGGIESDSAPLSGPVLRLLEEGVTIHCLRDLTRGGLAAALTEIAQVSGLELRVEERAIPVREDVRGACELLGLEPIHVANEGRFVAFVPEGDLPRTLSALGRAEPGREPALIGRAVEGRPGRVVLESRIGVARIVDLPSGEQLPRIC
jgi:hydrogenase expression/formation protein HypE